MPRGITQRQLNCACVIDFHHIIIYRLSLEAFSSELVMFCPGVIDQVYTALCSVLKFGDLEVKEVSQTFN